MPDPEPTTGEREAPWCAHCRHAPHGNVCFNMSSDNDCDCKIRSSEPIPAPVLPSEVQCWTYSGEALIGHRNHNLVYYGGTRGPAGTVTQFRCYRCGRIVNHKDQIAEVPA